MAGTRVALGGQAAFRGSPPTLVEAPRDTAPHNGVSDEQGCTASHVHTFVEHILCDSVLMHAVVCQCPC
jgi:hypothetical protein